MVGMLSKLLRAQLASGTDGSEEKGREEEPFDSIKTFLLNESGAGSVERS
jgi:hypothetical protein